MEARRQHHTVQNFAAPNRPFEMDFANNPFNACAVQVSDRLWFKCDVVFLAQKHTSPATDIRNLPRRAIAGGPSFADVFFGLLQSSFMFTGNLMAAHAAVQLPRLEECACRALKILFCRSCSPKAMFLCSKFCSINASVLACLYNSPQNFPLCPFRMPRGGSQL